MRLLRSSNDGLAMTAYEDEIAVMHYQGNALHNVKRSTIGSEIATFISFTRNDGHSLLLLR